MIPAVPLALGCVVLSVLWRRAETRARRFVATAQAARAAQDTVERTARLAARDLRDLALRLLGQATAASATPGARAPLAALAERCRTLADDLGAVGPQADAVHLTEDSFDLLACTREAVAATSATLAPGRRQFRLPPAAPGADSGGGVWIWADPRAIREVLGRVLAEAVLNTREDDSITLSLRDTADAMTLMVADEGLGLAGPTDAPAAGPVARDSRGIGAPLARARTLLEAHGGRLEMIAAAGAGTRVSLVFPAARRRRAAGAVVSPPASLTQALAATLPS